MYPDGLNESDRGRPTAPARPTRDRSRQRPAPPNSDRSARSRRALARRGSRGCGGGCGSRWPWSSRSTRRPSLVGDGRGPGRSSTSGSGSACRPASSCWPSAWPASSSLLAVRAVRAVAGVAARRPLAGDDARPLPARGSGSRSPTCSSSPTCSDEPAPSGLAGDGPAGRPAGERGPGRRPTGRSLWNRGRTAAHAGLLVLAPARPGRLRRSSPPDAARLSLARWLLGSTERWPQRTYLTVTGLGDGDRLLAPRDEPFALEVRADLPLLEPRGDRLDRRRAGASRWRCGRKPESPASPADGPAPRADRRRGRPRRGDGRDRPRRASATSSRRRRRRRPSSWSAATTGSGRSGSSASTGPRWPATKLRVKEPGRRRDGVPRRRRPRPAPALPARHRGRADPRRQRADRRRPAEGPSRRAARAGPGRRPGRSPPAGRSARRRRWRSCSPRRGPASTRSPRSSRSGC